LGLDLREGLSESRQLIDGLRTGMHVLRALKGTFSFLIGEALAGGIQA
jgi:hypothetical protein